MENTPKLFEYGDLYLKCGICKNESLVFESVPGGIQYTIYTKEDGQMEVKCPKCGTTLTYFFKEGKAPEAVNEYDSNEEDEEEISETDMLQARAEADYAEFRASEQSDFDDLDYSDYDSDEDPDWDPMDEEHEEPVLQEDQI